MQRNKKILAASAATILAFAAGGANAAGMADTLANVSVKGSAAITSDYIFRGISFSNEDPALQGSLNVSHPSHLYAGIFLSTVDKPWGATYNHVGGEEDVETDYFAGWAPRYGEVGFDVGVIQYGFEDNPDHIDWTEAYGGANWRWFSVRYNHRIGGMETGDYYEGAFRYTFADRYTVKVFGGHFDLDRNVRDTDGYSNYGVGVSTSYEGFNFDLTYHDTDSDGDQRYLRFAGSHLVLTISKNFDIYH